MSSFSLLSWQKRTRAALAYPFVQRAEMPLYAVKWPRLLLENTLHYARADANNLPLELSNTPNI